MPVTVSFPADGRGVVLECTGLVTALEVIRAKATVPMPTSTRTLSYEILNFTDAADCSDLHTRGQSIAMCDSSATAERPHKVFGLVGSPALLDAWIGLFSIYLDVWARPVEIKRFATLGEALAWSGQHTAHDAERGNPGTGGRDK